MQSDQIPNLKELIKLSRASNEKTQFFHRENKNKQHFPFNSYIYQKLSIQDREREILATQRARELNLAPKLAFIEKEPRGYVTEFPPF